MNLHFFSESEINAQKCMLTENELECLALGCCLRHQQPRGPPTIFFSFLCSRHAKPGPWKMFRSKLDSHGLSAGRTNLPPWAPFPIDCFYPPNGHGARYIGVLPPTNARLPWLEIPAYIWRFRKKGYSDSSIRVIHRAGRARSGDSPELSKD